MTDAKILSIVQRRAPAVVKTQEPNSVLRQCASPLLVVPEVMRDDEWEASVAEHQRALVAADEKAARVDRESREVRS